MGSRLISRIKILSPANTLTTCVFQRSERSDEVFSVQHASSHCRDVKHGVNSPGFRGPHNNICNDSLELGASMMTPHFTEEMVNELKFSQIKFWGDVPES